MRIDYGDPREPEAAVKWLWRFVDGAKTAGELYGRALVVIAAEQYASRLVVPASQRTPASSWPSHKDLAAKALRKLAGAHLPASLKQLDRAVQRAHRQDDIQPKGGEPSAPAGSEDQQAPPTAGEVDDVEEQHLGDPEQDA